MKAAGDDFQRHQGAGSVAVFGKAPGLGDHRLQLIADRTVIPAGFPVPHGTAQNLLHRAAIGRWIDQGATGGAAAGYGGGIGSASRWT